MKFQKDAALEFLALAAHNADTLPEMEQSPALLSLAVMTGEAIHFHSLGDATKFRRRLIAIAALCAIAEQWTQPELSEEDCPDCAAQAAAEARAKLEAQQKADAEDLTLKDFYWTIHGDASAPFGAMLVTRQRSSYPHIDINKWNLVRARDYGHAVVKAAEIVNTQQPGN